MFSVGRESMSGVFVLAAVTNADNGGGGVSASRICEQLESSVSCVSLLDEEVGDVLRALERQGLVEQRGVGFVATEDGRERVEMIREDMLLVSDQERADGAVQGVMSAKH